MLGVPISLFKIYNGKFLGRGVKLHTPISHTRLNIGKSLTEDFQGNIYMVSSYEVENNYTVCVEKLPQVSFFEFLRKKGMTSK